MTTPFINLIHLNIIVSFYANISANQNLRLEITAAFAAAGK
jgi:hypothetical protein